MAGTFDERTRLLGDIVGGGRLTGRVVVDQVYAQPIHEGVWATGPLAGHANHPRHGGEQQFLTRPLVEGHPGYLQRLADRALRPGGLHDGMRDSMEDLAGEVARRAPIEFGDLRGSGHPIVTDEGATVYDRPPVVPRLSREELAAKGRLRELRNIVDLPMTAQPDAARTARRFGRARRR